MAQGGHLVLAVAELGLHPQSGDGSRTVQFQNAGRFPGCNVERLGQRRFTVAFARRIRSQAVGQVVVQGPKLFVVLSDQGGTERGQPGAFRIGHVVELEVAAPALVGDDLARFLIGDRQVEVLPAAAGFIQVVGQGRIVERLVLAVEIGGKRQVDRGFGLTVQVDPHVPLLRRSRPNSPDAAGTFHLGHHDLIAFGANDSIAVAVGVPAKVLAGGIVVLAGAIIAGPLLARFPRRRQDGWLGQIRHPLDQITVAEGLLGPRRRRQREQGKQAEHRQESLGSHGVAPDWGGTTIQTSAGRRNMHRDRNRHRGTLHPTVKTQCTQTNQVTSASSRLNLGVAGVARLPAISELLRVPLPVFLVWTTH